MAASKYSSVAGVPIVNQQGKRIANTALPNMPAEWADLKRQAEIDAAFIVKAVNNHERIVAELKRLFDLYGHQATKDVLDLVGGEGNDC
jgi:hypothetical protein